MAQNDDKVIEFSQLLASVRQRVNGRYTQVAPLPPTSWREAMRARLHQPDLRRRLTIATLLLALQLLYFPINKLAKGKRNLSIGQLDGRIPRLSVFVMPYIMGLSYLSLKHYIAALFLSRRHFQEHVVATTTATLTGFTIWLLYPAHVSKKPFTPRPGNAFDKMLYWLHIHDKDYGRHNSFPSSHVYYVAIGLRYLSKEYPDYYWFFFGSSVANAVSTLFTHQHYIADVVAGFGLSYAATMLSEHVLTPLLVGETPANSAADNGRNPAAG
jgi:membrane-associated phospholipid phosphatase